MIRTVKFNIQENLQTEFNELINERGLTGTVISKREDICVIEIIYTKEQTPIIDETEKIIDVFIALASVCTSVLSDLAKEAQKNEAKKVVSNKTVGKQQCFFKEFATQNAKE